jgi:NDP-sugar pyrophosphorylase family protein
MKKYAFFLNITIISTFFVLFFSTGTYADCTKDVDCKGERVCEKGVCVDPGSSPAAINAKKQNDQEEFLRKINGARYTCRFENGNIGAMTVVSDSIIMEGMNSGYTFKIDGHKVRVFVSGTERKDNYGIISNDGSAITYINGQRSWVYKRE